MSDKSPYVCEAQDQSTGRPATFIFLHGYADDAEGLPLGLAQQFQWHSKLPYLRWVLPNAPIHAETRERAWYRPKALPNAMKPRVPGREDEEDELEPDDEEGIMHTVGIIDELVQAELARGIDPARIIVGGFSQGCAVSLVWGVTGKTKDKVAGVVCMSGYFPLADRIATLREQRKSSWQEGATVQDNAKKQWLLLHGSKDMLVSTRLFREAHTELQKWVDPNHIQTRLYDGMGHSTCNAELRDLLLWLGNVIPA